MVSALGAKADFVDNNAFRLLTTQLRTVETQSKLAAMQTDDLERDDAEHPVPEGWRGIFQDIANAFADGDFRLKRHSITGVGSIDEATAAYIEDCANAYGDPLTRLDAKTWERSVYLRTDGGWFFLVDLSTKEERVSDLALHAKFHEVTGLLELQSVHVP